MALVAVVATVVLVAGACGRDRPELVFGDTIPPRSATSLVSPVGATTEAGAPQPAGPWVDVTGNLAGMESECGNMSYVTGWPGSDQVIAGVARKGLWINTAGDRWTQMAGSAPILNRPQVILFDPTNADQFWESGSYGEPGPGAARTSNAGTTFDPFPIAHVDGISVDLSEPSRRTMLAGAHERVELFRSTDGGATWADVAGSLPQDAGFPSQPYVVDAQTHLVGTVSWGGSRTAIFRTTDGGQSWTEVWREGPKGPPLVASDQSIYWALDDGSVVRSTDRGETWNQVGRRGTVATYNLVELPDGRIAGVGKSRIVATGDQGLTWQGVGPEIPLREATGLASSVARNAIFVWKWDCTTTVPAQSVWQLDLPPPAPAP